MKEYIEREAALDIVTEWCPDDDGSVGKTGDLRDMLDELEAIPTADVVEVRHGEWVLFDNAFSSWNVWVCSECGYRRKEGWMHTEAGKKPNAQYCEHCMAKMDGGVNDV
jgi:hypothetical protein